MAIIEGQEQLITLSYGQLQQVVEKAILEATEPLYREIAYDPPAKGSPNLSRRIHNQYRRIEARS